MDRTLDEAVAGFDDDALLKMMVAQCARTFPTFEAAPDAVKRARDRFVALASAAPKMRDALAELEKAVSTGAAPYKPEYALEQMIREGRDATVKPELLLKCIRALRAADREGAK